MSDTYKILNKDEHPDDGVFQATVELTFEKMDGDEPVVYTQELLLPENEKDQKKVLDEYIADYRKGLEKNAEAAQPEEDEAEEEKAE